MQYPIRINKYLRDKGIASRKEADKLVSAGLVMLNKKRAEAGAMVKENDEVEVHKSARKKPLVYLAYYKPRGLATQGPKGTDSVITDFVNQGIFPVGRLDRESEGLIILTNDGRLTTAILGGDSKFEKEYAVRVRERLRQGVPGIFRKGMQTEALGFLKPAGAKILGDHALSVVLHEGKRHQIRVMLAELGYTVTSLKRVRIGHVTLSSLRPGKTQSLTEKEVAGFFAKI